MSHLKTTILKHFPIASALRETLAEGYDRHRFKRDLSAAFVVSLIALPLSMALSIAIGLPPQHGLYTAIVAGFFVALLGGSKTQVTGPTAAFVVILAPIVAQYGLHGLIWCQILAGAFLLIFAAARLGKLISYIPYTVTTGFTAGIALILGVTSLNDFLGLHVALPQGNFPVQASALFSGSINLYETIIGVVTLSILAFGARIIKRVPPTIMGVAAAIVLSLVFNHFGHTVDTIASRFSYIATDGATQAGIPPYPPLLHLPTTDERSLFAIPTWVEWSAYIYPALIIAVLAALESLLSATVADSMARTRHHPTSELNGLGIGNILAGLSAGIPATGALARTAAMVNNGGTSPFASAMHAILLLIYMMALAPFIGYMPMSALAAILLFTAYRMSHIRQCVNILKIAPRAEVIILISVFAMTVMVDMVAGITVGMAMSALMLMQRVTQMTHVERHHKTTPSAEQALLEDLPESVMLYRIRGPLFFSTTQRLLDQSVVMGQGIRVVIIDLTQVDFIDMSGLVAVKMLVEDTMRDGRQIVLACPQNLEADIKAKLKTMADGFEGVTYTTSTKAAVQVANSMA